MSWPRGHRKAAVRIRLMLLLTLCGAMGIAHVYTAQFGQEPARLDLVKIAEDLYVIHNAVAPGNTTVFVTREGVVLVDDKFAIDHAGIMAQLRSVTSQPLKYVINTHHHSDHTGGNQKLQALNVAVVSSARAREKMVDAADAVQLAGEQSGLPNVTFDDHASIHLGGKRVEMYYFGRGHTDGDIVVYFPEHRVLATGDLFTYGDETPQLIDYSGGGSAKEWPRTLDRVMQLDFDTVIPGHGVATTKLELRNFRARTDLLRSRVGDMIVQKKSRDEISAMLQKEFHWSPFHMGYGLDGLLGELR